MMGGATSPSGLRLHLLDHTRGTAPACLTVIEIVNGMPRKRIVRYVMPWHRDYGGEEDHTFHVTHQPSGPGRSRAGNVVAWSADRRITHLLQPVCKVPIPQHRNCQRLAYSWPSPRNVMLFLRDDPVHGERSTRHDPTPASLQAQQRRSWIRATRILLYRYRTGGRATTQCSTRMPGPSHSRDRCFYHACVPCPRSSSVAACLMPRSQHVVYRTSERTSSRPPAASGRSQSPLMHSAALIELQRPH